MAGRYETLIRMVLAMAVLLAGCAPHSADEGRVRLVVSAASSLEPVLSVVKTRYEQAHPDVTIALNFGGSGALQRQIEQGAPADLFLSAGAEPMDELEEKGLIVKETRAVFARNQLALIVPKGSASPVRRFGDLERAKLVAVGEPSTAPAGAYAVEALRTLGVWEKLGDSRITYAKDVRQVLLYVESGGVDAGVVYVSDARSSDRVDLVDIAPAGTHRSIEYPLAVVAASRHQEQAIRFAGYLLSPDVQRELAAFGFSPARGEGKP